MNRRSFFKTLLGVASVAVIGLPKASAAPVVEVKPAVAPSDFKVIKNRFTGMRPGPVFVASQGYGHSIIHETVRDLTHTHVLYRGFLYSYTHDAYAQLTHRMSRLREKSGGLLGNCGHARIYAADKIVRVDNGMVMKDRYGVGMRESEGPTRQEWDELYGRPVSLI